MTINAESILSFAVCLPSVFDGLLTKGDWPSLTLVSQNETAALAETLHFFNTCLWNEEDLARRTKTTDSEIAANKRAIDKFNQQRNDQIEKLDEIILKHMAAGKLSCEAHRSSETAGSMIDRLSILSLKIYHMNLQVNRNDVDTDHLQLAKYRLGILREQRDDLNESLTNLLTGMCRRTMYFKTYRQFKMYNDPRFNPVLVSENRHRR